MTWCTLCNGKDLPLCGACRRNVANHHDEATAGAPRLAPQILSGGRCSDWLAKAPPPPARTALDALTVRSAL